MEKKLVKHGNSLALIIDKPILDLLNINEETILEIASPDGKSLSIKPSDRLTKALQQANKKFSKTLKNLAK